MLAKHEMSEMVEKVKMSRRRFERPQLMPETFWSYRRTRIVGPRIYHWN